MSIGPETWTAGRCHRRPLGFSFQQQGDEKHVTQSQKERGQKCVFNMNKILH